MFDLTTYPKKQEIPQLKTVFSTLDTLCWKKSDTNDLDNLDEPAHCKEDNDSLLST